MPKLKSEPVCLRLPVELVAFMRARAAAEQRTISAVFARLVAAEAAKTARKHGK